MPEPAAYLEKTVMGTRPITDKFDYTEEGIRSVLNLEYLSNPKYLLHNLYVFGWESDYLAKTNAGYWYEVEIKISLADFKADFKKREKHYALLNRGWSGRHATPNYFSYCVPEHLLEKVRPLVPPYAGLLYVNEHGRLLVDKPAPKLHVAKVSDESLRLQDKFYYNWLEERRKNREHDEIVRRLKYQISFLKHEFKAVAGYSIDEEL